MWEDNRVKSSVKETKFNLVALLLLIGVFMAALDNGIISAALTTINQSFEIQPQMGAWGIAIYTLGMAVATPIAGKLADMYGRKKVYIVEVVLFGVGSLLVALSPNYTFFIIARLIQSLGGGGLFVIASAHFISTYDRSKQGTMLGALGAMNGIASVLGPNLGSLLIKVTGTWHWLFLINVPIAVFITIFVMLKMTETQRPVQKKMDTYAIIMFSLSTLFVMFGIYNIRASSAMSSTMRWSVIAFFVLAILGYAMMIWIEKRNEGKNVDAFLPYELLRKPTFSAILVMGICSGMLIGAIIFIPSFVENVLHVSAADSGFWLTPLALASGVGASMGGRMVDKKGPVFALVVASLISILGYGGLAILTSGVITFLIFSIIAGLGFGFTIGAPMTVLATRTAGYGDDRNSTVIATLSVSRQMGITIAPTLFATLIQLGFSKTVSKVTTALTDRHLTQQDVPQQLMSQVEQVNGSTYALWQKLEMMPNTPVRQALMEGLDAVASAAFMPVFLTAAFGSVVILVLTLIFRRSFSE
ncbi:MFS transporter [Staphylococcus muscae]|nr:MFS transporter [Staphylococcus muscae]PNZ04580.1 MFS transporter [Staphylococcus muscae]